ncbi:hypothetical protein NDN08_006236 [Rhodosorus marinus]|uniref:Uncharacterized protein n=1 Tax=Rhodosorus marinus TaxID=101924 RepID=A0AAV8UPA2_9RHOD|nr:hypothetical protein NDN08_006236 [Rhodosorus marinus]
MMRNIVRTVGKGKPLEAEILNGEYPPGGLRDGFASLKVGDEEPVVLMKACSWRVVNTKQTRKLVRFGGRKRLTLGVPLPVSFRRSKFRPSLPVIIEERV